MLMGAGVDADGCPGVGARRGAADGVWGAARRGAARRGAARRGAHALHVSAGCPMGPPRRHHPLRGGARAYLCPQVRRC